MRRTALFTSLALTPLLAVSCANQPADGPRQLTRAPLLEGYFVGSLRVTDYSSTERHTSKADISFNFRRDTYSVSGTGAVIPSTGRFYVGPQLFLKHERMTVAAGDSNPTLRGLFDYKWGGDLLMLEQWDEERRLLTVLVLERTARAQDIFQHPIADATERHVPWGPPRTNPKHPQRHASSSP